MATIDVVVKPRSHVERLSVDSDGVVTVAVTAPPVEGAANAAVVRAIARALRVPPSTISIVRGLSGRRKLIVIDGLEQESLWERLRRTQSGR